MASAKTSLPRTPRCKRTDMAPPLLIKPATPGRGQYDPASKSPLKRGSAMQALGMFLVSDLVPFTKVGYTTVHPVSGSETRPYTTLTQFPSQVTI